jgi:hypothetical protein
MRRTAVRDGSAKQERTVNSSTGTEFRNPLPDAVGISQQEGCRVDVNGSVNFAQDIEPPDDRTGKRFINGAKFVNIRTDGAIPEILLHHQDLRTGTLERHDARRAELSAIQAYIIGPDPSGKR